MILDSFYRVVRGGFDFYGFDVTETDNGLLVGEGRIGLTTNPLMIVNDTIDGGWYVPEKEIPLSSEDVVINLLLNKKTNTCIYSVRQNLDDETYDGSTYDSLLVLAARQNEHEPWTVAKPMRLMYE